MDNMTESDTSIQEEINRLIKERVTLKKEQIEKSSEIEIKLNENSKKINEVKEKCVHKWKLKPSEYHEHTNNYYCEICSHEK